MKKTTTRKIKASNDQQVTVTFTVDFSNASNDQLMEWALANRVIAGQRPWRELSPDELKKYVDGKIFDATTIGQKIQSPEEQIKKMEAAVDNMSADTAEAMLEKLQKKLEQNDETNE